MLAIPAKRFDKATVSYLNGDEITALLAAADRRRWEGRRDYTLMLVAIQTGLRISELLGLDVDDITLGTGKHLRCNGKGRKHRAVPLNERSSWSCGTGSTNDTATPTNRSSSPAPGDDSAPTASNGGSTSTPASRNPMPLLRGAKSARTFSGTPAR